MLLGTGNGNGSEHFLHGTILQHGIMLALCNIIHGDATEHYHVFIAQTDTSGRLDWPALFAIRMAATTITVLASL